MFGHSRRWSASQPSAGLKRLAVSAQGATLCGSIPSRYCRTIPMSVLRPVADVTTRHRVMQSPFTVTGGRHFGQSRETFLHKFNFTERFRGAISCVEYPKLFIPSSVAAKKSYGTEAIAVFKSSMNCAKLVICPETASMSKSLSSIHCLCSTALSLPPKA